MTNQPFYQTAVMPVYNRRAFVQILISNTDGMKDVTADIDPHLISVNVLLRRSGVSTAAIELDDREGSLPIPPDRAGVKILMGWSGSGPALPLNEHVKKVYGVGLPEKKINEKIGELPYQSTGMQVVFIGFVSNVESGFSRNGGGRRMWVECSATSFKSEGKTPSLMAMGQGQPNDGDGQQIPLADFFASAGKDHGFNVFTQGIDHIKRDFWAQDGESFLAMGQRLALAHGLNFEVWGNNAYLTEAGMASNGIQKPTIEAKWGMNLISWRIKPYVARAQWKGASAPFFDTWNGLWKSKFQDIIGSAPFSNNSAIAMLPGAAPNAQVGEQTLAGISAESTEKRGTGWVIINGEPSCIPGGTILIQGARPGVDGGYRIDESEHNYTRGGGYTTRCNLNKPDLDSDYFKSTLDTLSTNEIEKQLAEHPFFAWQEDGQVPYNPQFNPELVNERQADGGVEVIDPNTGEEAWNPN